MESLRGAALPATYFHLARAYQRAKRPADAREAFKKAQAHGLKAETIDPLERAAYDRLLDELRGAK